MPPVRRPPPLDLVSGGILAVAMLGAVALAATPLLDGQSVALVVTLGLVWAVAGALVAWFGPRQRVPLLVLGVWAVGFVVVVASPLDNDLIATVIMGTLLGAKPTVEVRDRR